MKAFIGAVAVSVATFSVCCDWRLLVVWAVVGGIAVVLKGSTSG